MIFYHCAIQLISRLRQLEIKGGFRVYSTKLLQLFSVKFLWVSHIFTQSNSKFLSPNRPSLTREVKSIRTHGPIIDHKLAGSTRSLINLKLFGWVFDWKSIRTPTPIIYHKLARSSRSIVDHELAGGFWPFIDLKLVGSSRPIVDSKLFWASWAIIDHELIWGHRSFVRLELRAAAQRSFQIISTAHWDELWFLQITFVVLLVHIVGVWSRRLLIIHSESIIMSLWMLFIFKLVLKVRLVLKLSCIYCVTVSIAFTQLNLTI